MKPAGRSCGLHSLTPEFIVILGMRTVTDHTPDLEAGKAFYSAFVGHAPYFDQPYCVGFRVAGFELGLMPDSKTGTGAGGTTFYWGTDDLEAEAIRVLALGATIAHPIADVGEGIRTVELHDPFGNLLGLILNPHFGRESSS